MSGTPTERRADLEAEIEQLRERVAALQASSGKEAAIAQLEIERLSDRIDQHHKMFEPMRSQIANLLAAIQRIDGINDNPSDYNPEINEVCNSILRPTAANPDDAVRVLTRDDPTGRRTY